MPTRSLDEASIRALTTHESFERGRDYWRRGAVSTLVRRGDELTAEVEGSEIEPYHVTIRLHEDGVADARCTRTPVDPEPIAAQARTVLAGRYRQRRYWDDYRSSGDTEELKALVDKAVPFLEAGDGRNALRILETIADTFVDEWVENIQAVRTSTCTNCSRISDG